MADQTPREIPLEALYLTVKNRFKQDLAERVGQAGIYLIQKIKRAYLEVLTVKRGEAGALGGLLSEVEFSEQFIELHLGVSEKSSYLANLEFGERGTQGGSGTFQRTKAPPVRNIYQWIRLASLTIPEYYVDQAKAHEKTAADKAAGTHHVKKFDETKPWYSTDPIMLYAYDIAQKRKRMGRAALRIIYRVLQTEAAKISQFLDGTAAA